MINRPANAIGEKQRSECNGVPVSASYAGTAPLRILVLDHDVATLERISSTLWVWPHHLASAKSVLEALRWSALFRPTIVIVTVDFFLVDSGDKIRPLRECLPDLPIIALGLPSQHSELSVAIENGADAFLTHEDLDRSNLHSLLARVQRTPRSDSDSNSPASIQMPLPWRRSRIVGSLICDVDGTIIAANECLATWLEFSCVKSLIGRSVPKDLMHCSDDWEAWTDVAGDVSASLYQSITVKSKSRKLLCMRTEVFAAPESPTDLQAMLSH